MKKSKQKKTLLAPIPPGEILLEEFMVPLGISQNSLARELDVPVTRIHDIIHARRTLTSDTALRLGSYFNTSAEFWLNLQTRYDLEITRRKIGKIIEKTIHPLPRNCEVA